MAEKSNTANVQVTMASVIDQIHHKYGVIIARLTQENAELQAGVDAQDAEIMELRSKVEALTGAVMDTAPNWQKAPVSPDGLV